MQTQTLFSLLQKFIWGVQGKPELQLRWAVLTQEYCSSCIVLISMWALITETATPARWCCAVGMKEAQWWKPPSIYVCVNFYLLWTLVAMWVERTVSDSISGRWLRAHGASCNHQHMLPSLILFSDGRCPTPCTPVPYPTPPEGAPACTRCPTPCPCWAALIPHTCPHQHQQETSYPPPCISGKHRHHSQYHNHILSQEMFCNLHLPLCAHSSLASLGCNQHSELELGAVWSSETGDH